MLDELVFVIAAQIVQREARCLVLAMANNMQLREFTGWLGNIPLQSGLTLSVASLVVYTDLLTYAATSGRGRELLDVVMRCDRGLRDHAELVVNGRLIEREKPASFSVEKEKMKHNL